MLLAAGHLPAGHLPFLCSLFQVSAFSLFRRLIQQTAPHGLRLSATLDCGDDALGVLFSSTVDVDDALGGLSSSTVDAGGGRWLWVCRRNS